MLTGSGSWRIVDVPDLLLQPGDYLIGAFYSVAVPFSDRDRFASSGFVNQVTPLPAAGISYTGIAFSLDSALAFPSLTETGTGVFGPTFFIDRVQAVPEPGSIGVLVGIGAIGSGILLRRRK